MNKISLIIQREYLTRVKKKSFVVMTILGPILMAAVMIIPIYLSQVSDETKTIEVVDETNMLFSKLVTSSNVRYIQVKEPIVQAKEDLIKSGHDALLYIPESTINEPSLVKLYSQKQVGFTVVSYIENTLKSEIERIRLTASGIDQKTLSAAKVEVKINNIKMDESGIEEKNYAEIKMVIGLFVGFLIYFFIFLYGAQVMRGVIEEKTNRVVEIIVSSVKPFQLMMGKIVGVALVGLTQFLLWVVFTSVLVGLFTTTFSDKLNDQNKAEQIIVNKSYAVNADQNIPAEDKVSEGIKNEALEALGSINFGVIIFSFLFYFLGGYLLYAALFAAVGAAVDNETDTQQFMLPITIPLIFAIVMLQMVANNPDGPWAFWLSIIPFTSPVIMMMRIPFGVPYTELLLSMSLLALGFLGTTWMAAKIYRTGILMYGKKVNYQELWKWIKYKS